MVMYANPQTEQITTLPAFTHRDMRNINRMITDALLSSNLQRRLINLDAALQLEFDLSSQVWTKICQIKASSLSEFCGELVQLQGDIRN
jgi:hypothetical protein